ncbi:CPBP family intramembrane metalloprotease [Pontibacter diazotrophicus]|uniref:CPBP family intramembrane metalloprotease n=1 Tax=Pontibacter diazotrophicus TaxID=1400979 RepID=A0A3D8L8P3_9BACT|nr:CPBP family intramembrane glutamic endopeptidase [Pontibacter diazotrophicus]RDV13744.1 CPBP family intramembrane metalloprotease [Pontibacter diazotrophicus]
MHSLSKLNELESGSSILLSLLILPITFASFFFLPQLLGKTAGYLASFCIYWIYCLLHGLQLKRGNLAKLYAWPPLNMQNVLLLFLCFVPAVGAFFAAFLKSYNQLNSTLFFILAAAALVNGFIEEFYWRGAFISRYKKHIGLAFVFPAVLFGLWHISVYAAYGITYQGGFLPLVGGAFFMGCLWGYTAYKQQRVLAPTLAHILTNFFAFSGLLVDNWVR